MALCYSNTRRLVAKLGLTKRIERRYPNLVLKPKLTAKPIKRQSGKVPGPNGPGPNGKGHIPITVHLSLPLVRLIGIAAADRRLSKSWVVESAVREWMRKRGERIPE